MKPVAYTNIKHADRLAHPCRLISIFIIHYNLRLIGNVLHQKNQTPFSAFAAEQAGLMSGWISRWWKGEHERLYAMKHCLGSGRISPPAGVESGNFVIRSRERQLLCHADASSLFWVSPGHKSTKQVSWHGSFPDHKPEVAFKLSFVMRKPVFGIFDQVRLKKACSADETS